jgi:glycosyltransferase involved in cell wall biosynthesis
MDMSVVIPVFNEAEGLSELRRRLTDVLDEAQISFEVILVDDGSQDHSRSLMAEFHQQDERFLAVCLSRNFGHQIAITAGLMHAKGDAIAIMDAIPVRFIIQFGFLTAITSFFIGLAYMILKLLNIGTWPSGFASLFLLIAFLGGIQLITIGMIGEYVARVHMEVKKRPLFLVDEYIGLDAPAKPNHMSE